MNYVCGINTLESPQETLTLYACTRGSSASQAHQLHFRLTFMKAGTTGMLNKD